MTTLGSRVSQTFQTLILAGAILLPTGALAQTFTTDFDIDRCTFSVTGRHNPYFSLRTGDRLTLASGIILSVAQASRGQSESFVSVAYCTEVAA